MKQGSGGDPLIVNIVIPSLSQIAVMPDAAAVQAHLRSAVQEQVKLSIYVKALVERALELYAGSGGEAL